MLDVKVSVRKNIWQPYMPDERDIMYVCAKYGMSNIEAKLLLGRVNNLDEIDKYLDPKILDSLPDMFTMLDMEKGVDRVIDAIKKEEKITIFGDYDVDGATSTAVLIQYFKMINFKNYNFYIPDRMKEGYGPNENAMKRLVSGGTKLVITVDCGTTAFEPIAAGTKLGLDIIIIDHHISEHKLPDCLAVINPNRIDEQFPHRNLAAVGVAFLFICGMHKKLKSAGYFDSYKKMPNILSLLDIVALGTVCDVMTITGLNRVFVVQGLKYLGKKGNNIGLSALIDVASISQELNVYHLGYILGPRINAGGRVGESRLGVSLLTSDDYAQAYEIAVELDGYNNQRKSIEKDIFDESIEQIEKKKYKDKSLIFTYKEGWHPGVIGVVCGKIKELYNKPCAVIAFDKNIGKASARSVDGIDIGANIINARNNGILVAGGGHAMAAGFTVEKSKLQELYDYLNERISAISNDNYIVRYYDSEITELALNNDLIESMNKIGPYGNGNPEPLFLIRDLKVIKADLYPSGVLKAIMTDYYSSKKPFSVTLFKADKNPMTELLLSNKTKKISIIGRVAANYFNFKKSIEFYIEDIV